jgi:hypothetical protein
MNDEEYVFRSESRDKAITARSARKRRTHNGKSGRVKFPSDYLTKKELKAMSGSVESYRLNDPMKWDEFKKMPDDLKCDYIKALRKRFYVPDCKIADMMGVGKVTFSNWMNTLGLCLGKTRGKDTKWDEAGWYAWANNMPIPEPTEAPIEEEATEEPPVTEPIPEKPEVLKAFFFKEEKNHAVPDSGTMTFEGRIEDIANTLIHLLGGAKVHIGIQWDVMED